MKFILIYLVLTTWAFAFTPIGGLKPEDQKYFKNDIMQGNNQLERIDLNVKEINKLHGEVASLKEEVQKLKEEIEKMKKRDITP